MAESKQTEYGRFETALRQVLSAPKQKTKPKAKKPKKKKT
jgi:hypothetical protein